MIDTYAFKLFEQETDKKQFKKIIRQMIMKKVVTDNLLKKFFFLQVSLLGCVCFGRRFMEPDRVH